LHILKGKKAIVLFVVELFLLLKMNMLISNLEQDVKVTPAHDMNDKTLGEAQP
jgi:hypothetical protein